ncbi:MAG: YigZ family protein [Lactobacillus sp.]|nr:YigZ family protein [Lactobacillus sp.]
MNLENYLTIKENGSAEQVIKKSRFITTISRVKTAEEAQNFIAETSKKYKDATHNTFAYVIGMNNEVVKASDNGEPSGTAGVPELRVLEAEELRNVAVVVTRYFGGIKLGASGLIRAYASSVSQAIQEIGVVKCQVMHEILLSIAYANLSTVEYQLKQSNIIEKSRDFDTEVHLKLLIEPERVEQVKNDFTNLLSGQLTWEKLSESYQEISVNKNDQA